MSAVLCGSTGLPAAMQDCDGPAASSGMAMLVGKSPMRYVFGIGDIGPLVGIPTGAKVKVKLRLEDFAYMYIRHGNTVSKWAIGVNDAGEYLPIHEQARNEVASPGNPTRLGVKFRA